MRLLRRFMTTVTAQVDGMLCQIENHDALLGAAIEEATGAAAKTQAQLAKLRRDEQGMRERITALEKSEQDWEKRAKELATTDEPKAIECLRRKKVALTERRRVEERLARQIEVVSKITLDADRLVSSITELKNKRALMRTRETSAAALRSVQGVEGYTVHELNDVFERWEDKVAEIEANVAVGEALGGAIPRDALQEEFESAEEQNALKLELSRLK